MHGRLILIGYRMIPNQIHNRNIPPVTARVGGGNIWGQTACDRNQTLRIVALLAAYFGCGIVLSQKVTRLETLVNCWYKVSFSSQMFLSTFYVHCTQFRYELWLLYMLLYFFCFSVPSLNVFVPYCEILVVLRILCHSSIYLYCIFLFILVVVRPKENTDHYWLL